MKLEIAGMAVQVSNPASRRQRTNLEFKVSLGYMNLHKKKKIKNKQKSVIIQSVNESQVGFRRDCMKGTR